MSAPVFSPASQCRGKEPFESAVLAHLTAKRRRHRGKINDVYRCRYCGVWHLGTPVSKRNATT